MIGVSAPVFDLGGSFYLTRVSPGSEFFTSGRRATRYGTLEGGAAMVDGGYSPADESVRIVVEPPTVQLVDTVKHLGESYQTVTVALARGCFRGVLTNWRVRSGALEFDIDLLGVA